MGGRKAGAVVVMTPSQRIWHLHNEPEGVKGMGFKQMGEIIPLSHSSQEEWIQPAACPANVKVLYRFNWISQAGIPALDTWPVPAHCWSCRPLPTLMYVFIVQARASSGTATSHWCLRHCSGWWLRNEMCCSTLDILHSGNNCTPILQQWSDQGLVSELFGLYSNNQSSHTGETLGFCSPLSQCCWRLLTMPKKSHIHILCPYWSNVLGHLIPTIKVIEQVCGSVNPACFMSICQHVWHPPRSQLCHAKVATGELMDNTQWECRVLIYSHMQIHGSAFTSFGTADMFSSFQASQVLL